MSVGASYELIFAKGIFLFGGHIYIVFFLIHTNHSFSCIIFYKSSESLDFMTNRPKYDPPNILGHSVDIGDMRGHAFGYQAPLPRPAEVARAACSIYKGRRRRQSWVAQNESKSWKSLKIHDLNSFWLPRVLSSSAALLRSGRWLTRSRVSGA